MQLDRRNLRTPAGKKLVIPKERRLLAALIAHEWDIQEEVLKQHALPMVRAWFRAASVQDDGAVSHGN